MQIIIPMSGFGERFRKVGYKVPKPLIEIEGKPIIAHVIDMFPGEQEFIFICNQEHLDNSKFSMEEILRKLCPSGKIVGIPPHKLGPVHAVLEVEDLILDDKETIVNYCDFTCYWDWNHFKDFVRQNKCDGAIPSYKGFHPHTLGSTNYAYLKEKDGLVEDIQEKQPYTDNRMEEFASSGTYYFSSGKVMKDAFHNQVDSNLDLNGEFYVSLSYKHLLKSNKRISIYPLQHFMQWGTPEDVHEYNYWSRAFNNILSQDVNQETKSGTQVIPMAGLGQRFLDAGYNLTKPLIPVSSRPMVFQAVNSLPKPSNQVFVMREDMPGYSETRELVYKEFPDCIISSIPNVTDGQASSALIGLEHLEENSPNIDFPITFGACDFASIYDEKKLQNLISSGKADIIVWAIRGYPNASRNPNAFGWIDATGDVIKNVSVKKPLLSTLTDPIILGTFTFLKPSYFKDSLEKLKANKGSVNDEFFIDSCINEAIKLGLNCYIFEVESYLCWGTPNDLKTFKYWQSCFHKWNGHPYKLEDDKFINKTELASIKDEYCSIFFRENFEI